MREIFGKELLETIPFKIYLRLHGHLQKVIVCKYGSSLSQYVELQVVHGNLNFELTYDKFSWEKHSTHSCVLITIRRHIT